jgi:hypothetical protein
VPAAAAGGDDDRNRIPIRIHNHCALSRPLYKTGSDALGTKCGGGSVRERDRHTLAANCDGAVGPIEQQFEIKLAHASLLAALAQMANCWAVSPLYVLHRSSSIAPRQIPCGLIIGPPLEKPEAAI